ncbi:RNA polymerase II associated Paf1 complex subunit Tpr1 [Trifolium repens]|nr:RNA polymerase II associated Paf1 complex subunit Tpr1 [Trifolium repens]
MAFSADGTRLFSCGTSKDGESSIVEWNESEGAVKRTYQGFRKRSLGVVQFDTTKNRYLVAGDDFSIKFWDMDNIQLLTTVDADGGLPASPRIRFNKEGSLLAVSANENGIKILANGEVAYNKSDFCCNQCCTCQESLIHDSNCWNGDIKPRISEESNGKLKIWKLTEINEPSHCRSLKIPENARVTKISRLIYIISSNAILALASNVIHLLWKWQRNARNSSGKATASVPPQLWQPSTNDINDSNTGDASPMFHSFQK